MLRTTCRATSGCWTLPAAGARVLHSIRTCTRPLCGLRTAPALPTRPAVSATRSTRKPPPDLGDEQVLLKEPGLRHFPTSWSRDGRFLLYHTENATNTGYDLWALSLRDRKPHLMLGEAFNEWAGVFSPDMRWVAYVSLETGAAQVYVRPFRVSGQTGQPSFGEGKWQVSKDYGNWPQWRIDREIVFNTAPIGTEVFAAPVNTTGTAFESGVPQRLPFPPSMGVSTDSAVHSRRPALPDRSATGSASGSNVNQRRAQLAGVVEAVKVT